MRAIAFAALLLLGPLAAHAQASVIVTVKERQDYADARRGLPDLKRHLEKAASRHLAPGQMLAVTLTAVDRAGHERSDGTRVIRDSEPARIALEFVLTDAAGKQIVAGKRDLRGPAYFAGSKDADPLRYEKALLDDWLKKEFGPARG